MQRRWLFDYDSTTADTFVAQIRAVNAQFGTRLTRADFTDWDTTAVLTPEQNAFMWGSQCFMNEDFQLQVRPVAGAVETILALYEAGEHGMFVSDRPAELFEVTREWLDRQGLDMIRLLFTRHKHSMSIKTDGMLTKIQAAWRYRLNTVVEDAPHHSMRLAEKPYIDHVFLLDTPTNVGISHPKIQRIFSWNEIESFVPSYQ